MKRITAVLIAAALATAGMAMAVSDPPERAERGESGREAKDPTQFLQQLVGQWSVITDAYMAPDQDPVRFEGQEHGRMLGRWLVSEYISEVEGQKINSILTIGYDPVAEEFVGTYINSMQARLWSYTGALDVEGTTLTLKTEGPFMGDPNQTTDFRVLIESKEADRWVMRSQILVPDDGQWFEFLRFE